MGNSKGCACVSTSAAVSHERSSASRPHVGCRSGKGSLCPESGKQVVTGLRIPVPAFAPSAEALPRRCLRTRLHLLTAHRNRGSLNPRTPSLKPLNSVLDCYLYHRQGRMGWLHWKNGHCEPMEAAPYRLSSQCLCCLGPPCPCSALWNRPMFVVEVKWNASDISMPRLVVVEDRGYSWMSW